MLLTLPLTSEKTNGILIVTMPMNWALHAYGDASNSIIAEFCDLPFGYVLNNTDCNEANASIHPGAEEVINCLDDNCNGIIDEGKWIQKANFVGSSRINAASFTIGDKAYIGTGKTSSGSYLKDLWEYFPVTNVWTQKADMGGKKRYKAVGFAIGNKGYIGTGYDQDGSLMKSFGEYDVATNSWTAKADFGSSGRQNAVGCPLGKSIWSLLAGHEIRFILTKAARNCCAKPRPPA